MPTVTDNECVELGGITRAAIYDSFISKTDDLLAIEGFLARLAEKHSPPRFGRMLDVGCGTGRVLPIVARISEKVTGIDMNAEYLEQARGYARELQLTNVDLQHCDLSQWKEQEAFDLVSMINGVFYYFESGVALEEAFAHVYAAVKPGGFCVAEGGNLLYFLRHYGEGFAAETVREIKGKRVTRRIHHSLDLTGARWTHHDSYEIEGYEGKEFREQHTFTIFTPLAIREALERVGFVTVSVHNGWNPNGESDRSPGRLVFVARKP